MEVSPPTSGVRGTKRRSIRQLEKVGGRRKKMYLTTAGSSSSPVAGSSSLTLTASSVSVSSPSLSSAERVGSNHVIIQELLRYLPPSDLMACRIVDKLWKEVSKLEVARRGRVDLDVCDLAMVMTEGGVSSEGMLQRHTNYRLPSYMDRSFFHLRHHNIVQDFYFNYGANITTLALKDVSLASWQCVTSLAQILGTLVNLRTLTINLKQHRMVSRDEERPYFEDTRLPVVPSVKVLSLTQDRYDDYLEMYFINALILHCFPMVEKLYLDKLLHKSFWAADIVSKVITGKGSRLTHLAMTVDFSHTLRDLTLSSLGNLVNLKLVLCFYTHSKLRQGLIQLQALLEKHAPTLRSLELVFWAPLVVEDQKIPIFKFKFPALPKLLDLTIVGGEDPDLPGGYAPQRLPFLTMKLFPKSFSYATHLPLLERLSFFSEMPNPASLVSLQVCHYHFYKCLQPIFNPSKPHRLLKVVSVGFTNMPHEEDSPSFTKRLSECFPSAQQNVSFSFTHRK